MIRFQRDVNCVVTVHFIGWYELMRLSMKTKYLCVCLLCNTSEISLSFTRKIKTKKVKKNYSPNVT